VENPLEGTFMWERIYVSKGHESVEDGGGILNARFSDKQRLFSIIGRERDGTLRQRLTYQKKTGETSIETI